MGPLSSAARRLLARATLPGCGAWADVRENEAWRSPSYL
jgi:hypothetical protein